MNDNDTLSWPGQYLPAIRADHRLRQSHRTRLADHSPMKRTTNDAASLNPSSFVLVGSARPSRPPIGYPSNVVR